MIVIFGTIRQLSRWPSKYQQYLTYMMTEWKSCYHHCKKIFHQSSSARKNLFYSPFCFSTLPTGHLQLTAIHSKCNATGRAGFSPLNSSQPRNLHSQRNMFGNSCSSIKNQKLLSNPWLCSAAKKLFTYYRYFLNAKSYKAQMLAQVNILLRWQLQKLIINWQTARKLQVLTVNLQCVMI